MSRNHGDSDHNEEQLLGHDFKLIRGIGPSTEAHLHNIGILTYAQLATISPADIVALISNFATINAERIIKQDWIGQAQALVVGREPAKPELEFLNREVLEMTAPAQSEILVTLPLEKYVLASGSEEEQPLELLEEEIELVVPAETENSTSVEESPYAASQASFLVDLELDEGRRVLQTHVRYVQDNKDETWSGWEPERLLAYVQERANLTQPALQGEPDLIIVPTVESEQPVEQPVGQPVGVIVQPQAMVLLVDQPGNPDPVLRATKPCRLHLTIDLGESKLAPSTSVEYSLYAYARAMGANTRFPVCETSGSFHSAEKVQLETSGKALPPGFYHLEGLVIFTLPSQIGRVLSVKAKSGLVHFC